MGLRQEKKKAQRGAILDAAESLFREQGFDATRIEDVTARVRVSRQTFFNYFASKDEVLREAGLRWLTGGIRRAHAALDRPTTGVSALESIRSGLRAQARRIASDREFMALVYTRSGVILPQGGSLGRDSDQGRWALTRTGFDAWAAMFRRAQQAGEIRDDVDPLQVAEMWFGIQTITTRLWLTDYWDKPGSLPNRIVRAFDMLVEGLREP